MGWTSKRYMGNNTHTSFNDEDVKDLLWNDFTTWGYKFAMVHLVKARTVHDHNEIYALTKAPSGAVFIMVIIVDIKDGEIFWKDIPDSMGPAYYNCPKQIVRMAPDNNDDYSPHWRDECAKKNIKYNPILINHPEL